VLLVFAGACRRAHPSRSEDAPECAAGRRDLAPGLVLERAASRGASAACLTLVRIDPVLYRLRVLTAGAEGGSRPAVEWARDYGLTGVINASMFAPDQRSIGLLVSGSVTNNGRDNPRLGGFLAFDPVDAQSPPAAIVGRPCPGFDLADLRRRYRTVVQDYRILDCDGAPIAWKDERAASASAVGVDRDGRVVFIHSATPVPMSELAVSLAAPELGIRAAIYVEGGPEAFLHVKVGDQTVSPASSASFWPIPNVIGFAPAR
jgi:hypothetical protein